MLSNPADRPETDRPEKSGGIEQEVTEVVRAMAPLNSSDVHQETRLVEDLGYDSLRLIELAIVLERAFSLPAISGETSVRAVTVEDVVETVRNLGSTTRVTRS
jgi:acyl carrier protein